MYELRELSLRVDVPVTPPNPAPKVGDACGIEAWHFGNDLIYVGDQIVGCVPREALWLRRLVAEGLVESLRVKETKRGRVTLGIGLRLARPAVIPQVEQRT